MTASARCSDVDAPIPGCFDDRSAATSTEHDGLVFSGALADDDGPAAMGAFGDYLAELTKGDAVVRQLEDEAAAGTGEALHFVEWTEIA